MNLTAYKCENISPFAESTLSFSSSFSLIHRLTHASPTTDYKYVRWIRWISVVSLYIVECNEMHTIDYDADADAVTVVFSCTLFSRIWLPLNGCRGVTKIPFIATFDGIERCINSRTLKPFKFFWFGTLVKYSTTPPETYTKQANESERRIKIKLTSCMNIYNMK